MSERRDRTARRSEPEPPAERRVRLASSLAVGVVALAAVAVAFGGPGLAVARAAFAALLLVAMPTVGQRLALRLDRGGHGALLVGGAHLVQALPLLITAAGRAEDLLAGLFVLGAANLHLRRADDRAAAGVLVLAPVAVTVGFALAPGARWLVLQPASVAGCVVGLLALQRRAAERRERARPAGVAAPGLLAYALPLTLLLFAVSFAVHIAANVLPEPLFGLQDRGGTVETQDAGREPHGATRDAQDTFEQIFPSELATGRGVTQLQRETVMIVTPQDGRDHGPLYMRGMVLDVLNERGATFRGSRGREYRGEPGEWTGVQRALGNGETNRLDVEQQPVRIRDGELGILFAPARLLAVERAAFEFDPDGLLIALEPEEDWFRFGCLFQERRGERLEPTDAPASHPDPLYVALPSEARSQDALALLAEEARRVTAGASNDAQRAAFLSLWFRREFTYDLRAAEFPGLGGVQAFLEERRGPCTWYATTACLMLRSLGISTRIATGFVAKSFDEELGAYVVTSHEGHAWIEVFFEEIGWVSFDPTPGEQREGALVAALEAADPRLGTWVDNFMDDLVAWAESGGETARMRDVLETLGGAPRAALRTLGVTGALALLAAVVVSAGLALRRRVRRANPGPRSSEHARDRTLRARLVHELASAGFPRSPSQTLRELAERAAARDHAFAPATGAASLLDRARFGAPPLSAGEVARVEEWLDALKNDDEGRADEPRAV